MYIDNIIGWKKDGRMEPGGMRKERNCKRDGRKEMGKGELHRVKRKLEKEEVYSGSHKGG